MTFDKDIKFNLEQELYQAEGLDWQRIDFDFDRLEAIDLIQRPDGIFSLLEECCMYEKPSQSGFVDKLFAQVRIYPSTNAAPKFADQDLPALIF